MLARIELPAAPNEPWPRGLDPTAFDALIRVVLALGKHDEPNSRSLVKGITHLAIAGALQDAVWCVVEQQPTSTALDVHLYDGVGAPVLGISGMRFETLADAEDDATVSSTVTRSEQDVRSWLEATLGRLLGKTGPGDLAHDAPLVSLGLDSLMSFELKHRIRMTLGATLPMREVVSSSINELTARVLGPGMRGAPIRVLEMSPVESRAPVSAVVVRESREIESEAQRKTKLICLPYAGAGAVPYETLRELGPLINPVILPLPGRVERDRMMGLLSLVRKIIEAHQSIFTPPFALFGHGTGAWLAYELARELRRRRLPGAQHLFVSAARAPQLPDTRPPLHTLSNERLFQNLASLGNNSARFTTDPTHRSTFLDLVRADLAMIETYLHPAEPALDIPITAFMGRKDPQLTREEIEAWGQLTTGVFQIQIWDGGHSIEFPTSEELPANIVRTLSNKEVSA